MLCSKSRNPQEKGRCRFLRGVPDDEIVTGERRSPLSFCIAGFGRIGAPRPRAARSVCPDPGVNVGDSVGIFFLSRTFRMASTVSMMTASPGVGEWEVLNGIPRERYAVEGPVTVTSAAGRLLTVAAERDPEVGSVSALIGPAGGTITLDRHMLTVTRGAVKGLTRFTMARDPGTPLRIRLAAGVQDRNDVGAAGFEAPVTLSLSFHKVHDAPGESSGATVVYFRPDGVAKELETDVRVIGRVATANLPHFSLFGLAWP